MSKHWCRLFLRKDHTYIYMHKHVCIYIIYIRTYNDKTLMRLANSLTIFCVKLRLCLRENGY